MRRAAALVALLVACAAPAGPAALETPSATSSAAPTPTVATRPTPMTVAYLVPITNFTARRDDVRLEELVDVLVPEGWEGDLRTLLPAARLTPLPQNALVARARAGGDRVALVPPELVDPSVKTLSLDGRFFWDRGLDLAAYPLRRVVAGTSAEVPRGSLWELLAAGEVIFGRGVQQRIELYQDPRRPFAKVRSLTRGADLTVATLESPLSGDQNRYCDSCMVFVGNERYADGLLDAGIGLVSLANNHIGDAGPRGVLDTVRVLDAAAIAHVGAGANVMAARRAHVVAVRGLRVALLGYNDVPPEEYAATAERAGNAFFGHTPADYAGIQADIREARKSADLVVVIAHWGIEYEDRPRPWVVEAAHAMVDAGADVIVGGHPHWVQSIELYRGAYVAYGLGNFVFDQMWSIETRQGTLQRLSFSGRTLRSVRIVPTLLEDWHQPRPLAPDEPGYRQTLERIWRNSVFASP